jgi:hypothetical protein
MKIAPKNENSLRKGTFWWFAALFLAFFITFSLTAADYSIQDGVSVVAKDVRTVHAKSVDLTPVHQWLFDHQGERPMKHWRQLRFIEPKGNNGTWDHCLIKTEENVVKEIYIGNLPPSIKTFLDDINKQATDITAREKALADEQTKLQVRDAGLPTQVTGDLSYVNAVMAARAQLKLDTIALEKKQTALQTDENNFAQLKLNGDRFCTVLAMFSGSKFGELEVWDCGYGSKALPFVDPAAPALQPVPDSKPVTPAVSPSSGPLVPSA